MTRQLLKTFVTLYLAVASMSCEREPINADDKTENNTNCFGVSYVSGVCSTVVLKIEDSAYYDLGESWKEHDNVFLTELPCGVDEEALKQGIFFISISDVDNRGECPRCLALIDYSGSKKYFITLQDACTSGSD